MKIKLPKFETKSELFKYLKDNQSEHLQMKKASLKEADCMIPNYTVMKDIKTTSKADVSVGDDDVETVKVRAIINTTNVMDSHDDVHIPKIWNKSLKENKFIKHLQEHQMSFDKIISDKENLKSYAKTYDWKDLGVDAEGKTQALVFDSDVKKDRNPFMFKQYKEDNVDNHSVGMFYVSLKLALNSNDEDNVKEKEEYDKHIDFILNKNEVEKQGYFWAVYEAKVREGSAVPLGSNYITPTLSRRKDTFVEDNEIADKASLSGYINFLNL